MPAPVKPPCPRTAGVLALLLGCAHGAKAGGVPTTDDLHRAARSCEDGAGSRCVEFRGLAERMCAAGDQEGCASLGWSLLMPRDGPVDARRSLALCLEGRDSRVSQWCETVALLLDIGGLAALPPNADQALKAAHRACGFGSPTGCGRAGSLLCRRGEFEAGLPLIEKACAARVEGACEVLQECVVLRDAVKSLQATPP